VVARALVLALLGDVAAERAHAGREPGWVPRRPGLVVS
jgi:hypothetical protein